jgi:hypothetical protein
MTAGTYGFGAPTGYFPQQFPTTFPHGGFAFGPVGMQAQPPVNPAQQQLLQQLLQIVPQQLQQLIQIVPQQLQQIHHAQQLQLVHLQQLLQLVPQQLSQIQQLVQTLPQQLTHPPFQSAQQPFGTLQAPNITPFGGVSQQGAGPFGVSGQGLPHTFGYGALGQVM